MSRPKHRILGKLEPLEPLSLIDVFPRAHDTSHIDKGSNCSKSTPDPDLTALVRAVAREYGLDQAELAEALDAAARDPAGAWLSYQATARELGIDLSPAPPQPVLSVSGMWYFTPPQAQSRKP